MCPLSYHCNGFVVTHALAYMMYCYTFLVLMNLKVLNNPSTEPKVIYHLYHAPCLACWVLFGSQVPALCNLYHVRKCMSYHKVTVVITSRLHCFHDYRTSIFSRLVEKWKYETFPQWNTKSTLQKDLGLLSFGTYQYELCESCHRNPIEGKSLKYWGTRYL